MPVNPSESIENDPVTGPYPRANMMEVTEYDPLMGPCPGTNTSENVLNISTLSVSIITTVTIAESHENDASSYSTSAIITILNLSESIENDPLIGPNPVANVAECIENDVTGTDADIIIVPNVTEIWMQQQYAAPTISLLGTDEEDDVDLTGEYDDEIDLDGDINDN